ncbi:MAG TPA: SPFH domain-containing protein [Phycisphaerae bacterium]|nr:SPFH domain-containing protein [Phycisphaerae bacterium]
MSITDEILGKVVKNRRMAWLAIGLAGFMVLLFFSFLIFWFVIRVEVETNRLLAYVNKTGRDLPKELYHDHGDQVVLYPELVETIAKKTGLSASEVREGFKGIQYEVRKEGRYFPNPYTREAYVVPSTIIKQNEIGVLIRKFGKPLPYPKTVATEPDERGPVAQVLGPGRHDVNLLAYDVQMFPAVQIPEGHVGVVTLLSGVEPKAQNTYVVEADEKGVQRETLPPGLEYYNPYLKRIDIVDIRSHKYDLVGDDAIFFPSSDSFTITIEGTVEWAIRPDRVAEVTVSYGDTRDILDKVILPNARSVARIQGSKLRAREFISGKTRSAFQTRLLVELKDDCWQQGIDIRAALVRDILPPQEIANLISQREQADQETDRSTNQMQEAKSEAKLVEQRELQEQNKAIGDARRQVVTVTKLAEQEKGVVVTQANRHFEVAKLQLQAAEKEAAAIRSRGEADANVVLFSFKAKAEPLAKAVAAFGDGTAYAQHFFLLKTAPAIQSIISDTEGTFADIFKEFQSFKIQAPLATASKEGK